MLCFNTLSLALRTHRFLLWFLNFLAVKLSVKTLVFQSMSQSMSHSFVLRDACLCVVVLVVVSGTGLMSYSVTNRLKCETEKSNNFTTVTGNSNTKKSNALLHWA